MFKVPKSKKFLYLGVVSERAAQKYGDTPITLDHDMEAFPEVGQKLTVREFAQLVADTANRLWAAGVRPSEHVAVYKTSSFDITVLACAVARIGAVPAMLSPHLDGETIGKLLERLERPTLLTDEAKLSGSLAGLPLRELTERVLSATGPHPDAVALADLAGAPERRPVLLDPDQPALMTHTSGTTGVPKLVVHSARSLGARGNWQDKVVSFIRKRETVAMHVSYVHSRMYLGLAVLQTRGMPMVFMDDGSPAHVADILVRHRRASWRPTPTPSWSGRRCSRTRAGRSPTSSTSTAPSTRSTEHDAQVPARLGPPQPGVPPGVRADASAVRWPAAPTGAATP
ncbi:hypothetical protein GCM10023238_37130 [Streptomyces heliomycini]